MREIVLERPLRFSHYILRRGRPTPQWAELRSQETPFDQPIMGYRVFNEEDVNLMIPLGDDSPSTRSVRVCSNEQTPLGDRPPRCQAPSSFRGTSSGVHRSPGPRTALFLLAGLLRCLLLRCHSSSHPLSLSRLRHADQGYFFFAFFPAFFFAAIRVLTPFLCYPLPSKPCLQKT